MAVLSAEVVIQPEDVIGVTEEVHRHVGICRIHLIEDLSEIEVTVAEVVEQTDRVNKFPGQDGVHWRAFRRT